VALMMMCVLQHAEAAAAAAATAAIPACLISHCRGL
jgi:hypothetical protein